jgi:hypothetical protein
LLTPVQPEVSVTADLVPPSKLSSATDTPPSNSPAVIEVPSPLDMRRLRQQLRPHSDLQLMMLVESGPRFEAAAAQEILRTRGYSPELLQVTRGLRQLPAQERLDALDRAATLPAAEGRKLLRWFLSDADAEVRLRALSMLATTRDPQLAELARQRAVDDTDPRVAELATKLLQSR